VVTDRLVSRSCDLSNCSDDFQLSNNSFASLRGSDAYSHAPTSPLENWPRVRSASADVPLIRYLARKIGIFVASARADIGILELSSISERGSSLA